jgi:hypothetical protein
VGLELRALCLLGRCILPDLRTYDFKSVVLQWFYQKKDPTECTLVVLHEMDPLHKVLKGGNFLKKNLNIGITRVQHLLLLILIPSLFLMQQVMHCQDQLILEPCLCIMSDLNVASDHLPQSRLMKFIYYNKES